MKRFFSKRLSIALASLLIVFDGFGAGLAQSQLVQGQGTQAPQTAAVQETHSAVLSSGPVGAPIH